MLDKRFAIDESPDIVVNLTFSTTVLTDGSGAEERNSNWQSPLLNFDLQKVILHKPQLDEIINFFQDARGAGIPFRYRDWSDYLVTAQTRTTRYGSSTQGILLPNADGVRNEFVLVKRYLVPSCTHYRAIAFPDSDTVTLYDANFNPFPDTDWVFADGKFIFTTPPPAGQLFCEGEFDVPVVFASDENQYRIKSTKDGNTYSIEGLQLNEVRSSQFVVRSLNTTDYQLPTTNSSEIDTVFALSGHFNSLVGLREQTEIITLASGFDKRTSRFSKPKGTYFLGKIPLHDDELDYLIAFFRCTKGKGLSWAFEDVSYQQKNVAVRFDEDNLSLRLNRQGRYETDGLKAIEVFEPLPVTLIDPFAVSTQEYLKFFTPSGNPTNPGNPSSPVSGYPAPPFYLVTLPYLSVFINSDNPKKLVSTYNGVQRIIGDIAYFDSLGAVNLNYRGNGKFYGTALSTDKTKFITFTDSGIGTVKNLDPTGGNLRLLGNIAWENTFSINVNYLLDIASSFPSVFTNVSQGLNPYGRASLTVTYNNNDPNAPGLRYQPNSFSYTDTRNVLGSTGSGFSTAKISWNNAITGEALQMINGQRESYPGSYSDSGSLNLVSSSRTEQTWEAGKIVSKAGSDSNSRNSTHTTKGSSIRSTEFNTNLSVTFISNELINQTGRRYYDETFTISGNSSRIETQNRDSYYEQSIPVVVCDHQTKIYHTYQKNTETILNKAIASPNNLPSPFIGYYAEASYINNAVTIYENELPNPIFNVGDLGIYIEHKEKSKQDFNYTSRSTNSRFQIELKTAPGAPPASDSRFSVYHYANMNSFNPGESTAVKDIVNSLTKSLNTNFYKIAYLSSEREAKTGYAGTCSFSNNQAIHDFYLNSSPSSLTINLSTPHAQRLNYVRVKTTTTTNSGAVGEVDTVSTTFDYQPLNNNDFRNFDLTGQSIIVKQTFAGNIYLVLCRVNSLVSTTSNNNSPNPHDLADIRTVTKLNCEIISVQKIKSFFTTSSFLFTVNGCEVFKFLDPYRTNLIKDQGKVYLAATMPPVTQYDTQTLVFQLVSDGLEFYGVFGGQVDSIPVSPGADKWIQYY